MNESDPTLSTATLQELADEFVRRSKGVFIAGRPLAEGEGRPNVFVFYGGDTDTVIASAEIGKRDLMQQVRPITLEDVT